MSTNNNSIHAGNNSDNLELSLLSCLATAGTTGRADVFTKCTSVLKKPEFFLNINYRHVYECILRLADRGNNFDKTLLAEEIKTCGQESVVEMGILDSVYGLQVDVDTTEEYARRISDKYTRAKVVECAITMTGMANQSMGTGFRAAELGKKMLKELLRGCADQQAVHIGDVVPTVIDEIKSSESSLIPTGIGNLDKIIGGVMPGEFIVLAARPSMGKTSLGLKICMTQAAKGVPSHFVSLEMKKEQLIPDFPY